MSDYVEMSEDELQKRTRALLDQIHPEKTDSVTFRRAQYDHAWPGSTSPRVTVASASARS